MLRSQFALFVTRLVLLTCLITIAWAAPALPQPSPAGSVPAATDEVEAEAEAEVEGDEPKETPPESEEEGSTQDDKNGIEAEYRGGIRLRSTDGSYAARIRFRVQSRWTAQVSDDIGSGDAIGDADGFRVQRSRFKIDGHAYRPWLKYYLEYGITRGAMLTFQLDVQPSEKFALRIGQYKIFYNRERVDSSGAQQFVDRSIVNRPFTVDRQTGPTIFGRLFAETLGDSSYAFGVFTGTGRGGALDDDHRPMLLGRWQWNFLGRVLPYSQSDTGRRQEPAGSLAFAVIQNEGRFTRFSSSGGGRLAGFDLGESGQFKLTQWMAELAYQARGLSLQSEYHWKRIEDQVEGEVTEFDGWYAQAGYFLSESFDGFPEPLELAVRVAQVNAGEGVIQPEDRELTVGANWFMNAHNNKLTFDVSRLWSTVPRSLEDTGWRARLQWDIQF